MSHIDFFSLNSACYERSLVNRFLTLFVRSGGRTRASFRGGRKRVFWVLPQVFISRGEKERKKGGGEKANSSFCDNERFLQKERLS